MASGRQFQVRRGTASTWASTNPTLLAGEQGLETDTLRRKIGNGTSAWNSLPYEVSSSYVQSRGEQLITNGTGLLGDNTNFSTFAFDGSDAYYSKGSFKESAYNVVRLNDEIMPVSVERNYTLSLAAKCNPYVGARAYFGISAYDADGYSITASMHMYVAGSTTTLAADLVNGATEVLLTSAAGFLNTSPNGVHARRLTFWNYVNSYGYAYPPGTYTRNYSGSDLWADGAINYGLNKITLNAPWAGGTIPAGTSVSQGNSGGTYKYITASNVIIPATWTLYTGTVSGVDLSGTNVTTKFPPGTAGVKLLCLLNRDTDGGATWISNVNFSADVSMVGSAVLAALLPVDGAASLLDADKLDGQEGSYYLALANATGSVTGGQIAANAVGTSQLASAAVTDAKVAPASLKPASLYGGGYAFSAGVTAGAWYTIAYNPGNRAAGRFALTDSTGGHHAAVVFHASAMYGNGAAINVLCNSRYSSIRYGGLRIKSAGTYDGALLQVYVQSGTSTAEGYLLESWGAHPWTPCAWVADGVDPSSGAMGNFAAVDASVECQVDLSITPGPAGVGALSISTDLYLGGALTQHKAWHAGNDGTGSGLDADLLDGQEGAFYRDAGNLNAGTIPSARFGVDTVDGEALVDGSVGSEKLVDNDVPIGKLEPQAATTVVGNSTGSLGALTAITMSTLRSMLGIEAGATADQTATEIRDLLDTLTGWLGTAEIADGAVTLAKLQDIATARLLGRVTASSGDAEELTAAQVRTLLNVADGANAYAHPNHTGDVTSTGDGATSIANDAVTNAKLRNSVALSVIGRSANSTGDPADIAAGTDGHVLRRSGTTLGFGTLAAGAFADDTIGLAKLSNVAGPHVVGRSAGTLGAASALTMSTLRSMLNVEDGATADQSAAEILAALLTVDGTGSGLDAALLEGKSSAYHLNASNLSAGSVPAERFGVDTIDGEALVDGTVGSEKLVDSDVPLGKLEPQASTTILGNSTGSLGSVNALSTSTVRSMLNVPEIAVGTSAPSTSALWFHSTDLILYAYDSSRSKWLSVNEYTIHMSRAGAVASGTSHYLRMAGFLDAQASTPKAVPVPGPITLTGFAWACSGTTSGWTHRLDIWDESAGSSSSVYTHAPGGTYSSFNRTDVNSDAEAVDRIGCSSITGSATVNDQSVTITYRRRPS